MTIKKGRKIPVMVKQKDFMEFLELKLNDMKSLLCVQNCFHIVVIEMNGSCKIFFRSWQTLFVDHDLMLCDCPGLVFPSFISTTAELVVNGILPIDQLRDCVPPINLISLRLVIPCCFSIQTVFIFAIIMFSLCS